jgi:NADH-quinone oxidoreductase subunit L
MLIGFFGNLPGGFASRISKGLPFVYRTLNSKYYIDEFYGWLILKPVKFVSQKFLYKIVDVEIIDGLVNEVGYIGRSISGLLSRFQNGNAHWYATYFLVGLGLLLFFVVGVS